MEKSEKINSAKKTKNFIKIFVGIISFLALLFGASSDGCSTYINLKNHFSALDNKQQVIDVANMVFDSMGHFLFEIEVPNDWDELSCGNGSLNCNIYKHPLYSSISATVWIKPEPEKSKVKDSIEFFGCPGNIDIFWCNENDVNEIEGFYGYKMNAKIYPKDASEGNQKGGKRIFLFPNGYELVKVSSKKSIIEYSKTNSYGKEKYKGYMVEYQSGSCCKYVLQCMAPKDKFIEYQNILNRIVSSFTPRVIPSFKCCDYELFYII